MAAPATFSISPIFISSWGSSSGVAGLLRLILSTAISYGLVTYAAFHTDDPAGVATFLLDHEDVEFACYPEGGAVVVRDRSGTATITEGVGGFAYDHSKGDPTFRSPIIPASRTDEA